MRRGTTVLLTLIIAPAIADATPVRFGSLAYVLQAEKLDRRRSRAVAKIAKSGRDTIVLDKSYDGSHRLRWRKAELNKIRKGKAGRKILAYVSVAEAESYRRYWKKKWDRNKDGKPDKGAPKFLRAVNPDWEGNYRVKYWHAAWQKIALRYVDGLVKQGFDGIWLDGVDGFETFEEQDGDYIDNRKNPVTRRTYRQDMIGWVLKLVARARAKAAGRRFYVIVQNGAQLLAEKRYLKAIDAIAQEDLFSNGARKQPAKESKYLLKYIARAKKGKRAVLLIEYPVGAAVRGHVLKQAKKNRFDALLTDRNLKTLGSWHKAR